MPDDVTISLKTRGAARAASDVNRVAGSVTGLGKASTVAGRGLTTLGHSSARAAGRGLGFVGDKARYGAAGLIGLGTAAGVMGLKFNASMEQNQVAFTNFLGSGAAARRELVFLQKTAAATPFALPQIVAADRRLLAFNFTAKQSHGWLETIGDAAAGAGVGAEGIDRMVTAIGQIKSKGRLQTEELMQLQELGLVNPKRLRKDLGLTAEEFANLGAQGIGADKGLRVLQKQWADMFGGQAAKQSKTFSGQLSTIRDNTDQLAGTVSKPAFDWLRADAFPALGKTTTELTKLFERKDLDLAEKLTFSRTALRRNLGPLSDEIEAEIASLDIGKRAADAFETGAPKLLALGDDLGWMMGKAAVNAFMDAGPLGKLVATGALTAKIVGALGPVGASGIPLGAGSAKNPIAVLPIGAGKDLLPDKKKKPPGILAPLGTKAWWKKAGGKALRVAPKVAKIGGPGALLADQLINADSLNGGIDDAFPTVGAMDLGVGAKRAGRGGRAKAPVRRAAPTVLHDSIFIDGQKLAKVVRRIEADRDARK